LGWRLDLILEVSSNLNDSVILPDAKTRWCLQMTPESCPPPSFLPHNSTSAGQLGHSKAARVCRAGRWQSGDRTAPASQSQPCSFPTPLPALPGPACPAGAGREEDAGSSGAIMAGDKSRSPSAHDFHTCLHTSSWFHFRTCLKIKQVSTALHSPSAHAGRPSAPSATLRPPQPPYGVPLPRAGVSPRIASQGMLGSRSRPWTRDAASPAPTRLGRPAALRRDPGSPLSAPADWQTTWKKPLALFALEGAQG